MKAGESVRASLLVSFRLIPQVNASTYLQPRTISLAFPISCSAPACRARCFYGSGEESSGGVKEGRHSVIAGLATSLTARMGLRHCVIIWHCDREALRQKGLWFFTTWLLDVKHSCFIWHALEECAPNTTQVHILLQPQRPFLSED